MRRHISILAAALVAAGVPATARAATGSGGPPCITIRDTITKTDSGHGTPAEWADLVLHRTTRVCGDEQSGYTVTLTDVGRLWTRPGAGAPNGTGGQIRHRVRGTVHGTYSLTVTGAKLARRHGDTSLSSTDYVKSLFGAGAQVTGGDYTWTYTTVCGETWVDKTDGDGQGAAAGNITGKRCGRKPSPTPTPTPTGSPSPSPTGTPAPSPTGTAPGEAPAPTPVRTDLPVTG